MKKRKTKEKLEEDEGNDQQKIEQRSKIKQRRKKTQTHVTTSEVIIKSKEVMCKGNMHRCCRTSLK